MATTDYGVNHPAARKHWSADVYKEALKRTYALKFMGKGSDSLVQIRDGVNKDKGDTEHFFLRTQLTGAGVSGDNTLEGNEESLTIYRDSVVIDQLRHAVRSGGRMSEQRVPFEVRAEARDGLADWFADRIDRAFFNQLCSNTAEADTRYTGSQATTAPTQYIGINHSTTASLSGSATGFNLTAIDRCVEIAQTSTYPIRPLMINGQEFYVLFLHPSAFTSLKTAVSASAVTWYDIQRAALEGGTGTKSPIFTGAAGLYNGCIIHVAPRVPLDTGTASVASNVFCGAQAAAAAFGKGYGPSAMDWNEELFDFGNQLGVACGTLWGLKKTQFNSADFSTIQIRSSHVVAASGGVV